MKSVYVSDLKPGEDVVSTFLVQAKDVRQKKTGDPYLSLTLVDKTGNLDAKMWDNVADVMDTFGRDDFVKVKGRVQIYQNRIQFTIHRLQPAAESEINFADFFPASKRDPEEMFAELREMVNVMENPHLRGLLNALLDDETTADSYKKAPAAKSVHHAFLGGLLEHVLSVCRLCRMTASNYEFIDVDLMLTGAVVHDIGKIEELSYQRGFGYTDEGQLLGHIVIGLRMVGEKINALPDFPPRLRTLVEHMIISHHGVMEFGSPKVPVFPEALLLHFLDNLDSKMENMRSVAEKDLQVEGSWTTYSPPLERTILKKDLYLNGASRSAGAEPKASPAGTAKKPQVVNRPKPQDSMFGSKLQEALKKES